MPPLTLKTSFNGAARFCARKLEPQNGEPTLHAEASMGPRVFARGNDVMQPQQRGARCRLQWGRAFLRAEILENVERNQRGIEASMGPRVFARGNSSETIRAELVEVLQWGRAFLRAEIIVHGVRVGA